MDNEIEINKVLYIKKENVEYDNAKLKILALPFRFIVIGKLKEDINCIENEKGQYYIIKNPKMVRRYGTTEGLGQLAREGILEDTILEDCEDMRVLKSNIIFEMSCNSNSWGEHD